MTTNQINYWKNREQEYHDRVTEQETHRANLENEHVARLEWAEQRRHNIVSEVIDAVNAIANIERSTASMVSSIGGAMGGA